MWHKRAERARLLAERFPTSRQILLFCAGLAEWQGQVKSKTREELARHFPSLRELIYRIAPPLLAQAARELDPSQFDKVLSEYWDSPGTFSPNQFFARTLLQPYAANLPAGFDCPWCRKAPQVGCLKPQGDGLAFQIVCGLCLRGYTFPRSQCVVCNESSDKKLSTLTAPEFPHLRMQTCDSCMAYLLIVDLSRDAMAIPEVDELTGLPLDLWAIERGYHKLQPNLAGV
jgi:formate dehydrogenase maturation protein FdhE